MTRWSHAAARLLLAALAVMAASALRAQPTDASRAAFQTCDAQAFLTLDIARNYMMSGRNRQLVEPSVRDSELGRAMADEVYRRVDAGQVRHPGELAAETLFKCATELNIAVGAPPQRVALCFTRTDIVFFLHVARSDHVTRQAAVSKVLARLTSRELYPVALVNQVADAVYSPRELPDLQQLMRAAAWTCVNQKQPANKAASAASQ